MTRPLCFVLMPFGSKPDASGALIHFDAVYEKLIAPAIAAAGLQPLRADEELTGGIIHKAMFERLLLCEYAVADLTTLNANVFYELGVRHAARPYTTILLSAAGRRLPFDVAPLRALPYQLDDAGNPVSILDTQSKIVTRLEEARKAQADSPVFTLIADWKAQAIDHTKTDTFRDSVQYSEQIKDRLAKARRDGVGAIDAVAADLGNIADQESGVVVDMFLSYRAVRAWQKMIGLYARMSPPLQSAVMVQEQLALAYNRAGESEQAEKILTELIARRGPSSETNGILGRVYKDRWEKSLQSGNVFAAKGFLKKAIEAYLKGFEADWRDAYPGINAVTLMELSDPPDPRREEILPVVRYAVKRRVSGTGGDYWDHATLVELAVLAKDQARAESALEDALAGVREVWEPETTARNLRLINDARRQRGELVPWMEQVEDALHKAGAPGA
jgi:tetratricopeptide (TPR) repeat protein